MEADGLVNQWTGHKVQIGFVPKCRGHLFRLAARGSTPAYRCQFGTGRKWERGGPGVPSAKLWQSRASGDLTSTKLVGTLRLQPYGSTVPSCRGRIFLAPWIPLICMWLRY